MVIMSPHTLRSRVNTLVRATLSFWSTLFIGLLITQSSSSLNPNFFDVTGAIKGESPPRGDQQLVDRPAEFSDKKTLWHNEYVIQLTTRRVTNSDIGGSYVYDVESAIITRGNKILRTFDAHISCPLGVYTTFGLFPFLSEGSKQLFITQDVPRGGSQWVVNLEAEPRVVFDGQRFGVGREGYDLSVADFNGDGIREILVPITDFYALHDKISMAGIPLPTIVFKYDAHVRSYVPANPEFAELFLTNVKTENFPAASDEELHRSEVLAAVLDLIYVGRKEEAWHLFEKSYKLSDKREIRHRVKAILEHQPVYRFLYNQPTTK